MANFTDDALWLNGWMPGMAPHIRRTSGALAFLSPANSIESEWCMAAHAWPPCPNVFSS
jgi:hypothetical protein